MAVFDQKAVVARSWPSLGRVWMTHPTPENCAWDGYTEDCGLSFEEGKEIGEAADGDYRWAVKGGYLPRLQELSRGTTGGLRTLGGGVSQEPSQCPGN